MRVWCSVLIRVRSQVRLLLAPQTVSPGHHARGFLFLVGQWPRNRALTATATATGDQDSPSFGPGRVYYDGKLAEGKSRKEALRALKRQLSNVVWRHLVYDADRYR